MRALQRLFQQYHQKDISEKEKQLVDAWYNSFDREEDPSFSAQQDTQIKASIWRKLSTQLQLPQVQPQTAGEGIVRKTSSATRYLAAATVTALMVTGAWLAITYTKRVRPGVAYASIDTRNGRSKRVKLPDGSSLLLNPGSTIRFAEKFDEPQREIFMPEGEVYYDIAKDSRRPFIIHAGGLTIRVLGTSFNIRTIPGLKEQEVLVKDGLVRIQRNDKVLGDLTAGKQLVYDTTDGHYLINDHKGLLAEHLQLGWLVLDDASFTAMRLLIENRYHVMIIDRHGRLTQAHFTTSFRPETSLQEMIKVLCSVHHLSYTIKDSRVIID